MSYTAETPYASNTALPITTSCSFNRSLWMATGNQIGREARAFMNMGSAYSTFWAPVINIVRDVSVPYYSAVAAQQTIEQRTIMPHTRVPHPTPLSHIACSRAGAATSSAPARTRY